MIMRLLLHCMFVHFRGWSNDRWCVFVWFFSEIAYCTINPLVLGKGVAIMKVKPFMIGLYLLL